MKAGKNKEIVTAIDNLSAPAITIFAQDAVYTLPEVAQTVRVSTSHVRRAIQRGDLIAINWGGEGIGADRRILGCHANAWIASRIAPQSEAK